MLVVVLVVVPTQTDGFTILIVIVFIILFTGSTFSLCQTDRALAGSDHPGGGGGGGG